MTIESAQQQGERDDPFASLSSYGFVLLTTMRKSGVGVPTAMWFAYEQGKFYMVTGRTTGKIKRIRTHGRVSVAPYDLMGNVLGPHIEASAHELPVAQHAHADALLAQKYGEEYEMDSSVEKREEYEETFIEIVSTERSPAVVVSGSSSRPLQHRDRVFCTLTIFAYARIKAERRSV